MEAMNEFERERAERIERNKQRMLELGLEKRAALLNKELNIANIPFTGNAVKPRTVSSRKREPAAAVEGVRRSRRMLGSTPHPGEDQQDEQQGGEQQGGQQGALGAQEDKVVAVSRKGQELHDAIQHNANVPISAPFSLRSIGVTVWELGRIYRGPWADKYWSSRGCRYHHAYPVGYRATKVEFGRVFTMSIAASPSGPVFQVVDDGSGAVFSGESPTKPWTDICIARKTGQRISGPLYFGFSDLTNQRAIASLYTAAELEAALQGLVPERTELSPEEAYAAELSAQVEGIGASTAMVLATTHTLRGTGGKQLGSLAELRSWVQQGAVQQEQLRSFLLHSDEMPVSTRRWPPWTKRIVPGIMAQLLGAPE